MVALTRQVSHHKDNFVVNIKHHHGQCEMNFHLCMGLIPDCREENSEWCFTLIGVDVDIRIRKLESAPYTTTLQITQNQREGELCSHGYKPHPLLVVRLYHDVEMAEVVAWDNHRHWHPVYSYPNRKMYHRDEKLALNRFLGEWLVHCRKLGISPKDFVNPLP